MNSHMEPSTDHTSVEHDPHKHRQDGAPGGVHIGHNEEESGEKQSMMTKVKAKARRIKNSIKEHVGHGHDHDHDDEEDDDDEDDDEGMDTDSLEKRGTHHTSQGVTGQHEPRKGGATAAEGAPVAGNPGDYQTFYPSTARHAVGQDETTLGGSRTDTGRPKESREHPYAPRSSPTVGPHMGGGHSTGDLEVGQKGGPVKLGGLTGRALGDVEEEHHHHPSYNQAKGAVPTSIGYDSTAGQGHGRNSGERTAMEGVTHVPMNNPRRDHAQYDEIPASYVPGQESALRAEEESNASVDALFAAQSGLDSTFAHSLAPEQHRSNLGERTAMEGVIHEPTSKHQGHHQTFQPTTASHTSGQEDNLAGWIRSDAGMLKGSDQEMFNKPKYTPVIAHLGKTHGTGAEEGNVGKLGGVTGNPTHLESDPRDLRDLRGKHHAESYESNVTDPTGKGGESIGLTPVLHQLDKMNIHEEPRQNQDIRFSQEDSMFVPKHSPKTGSHDQFFPELVTSETGTFLETPEVGSQDIGDEGWHDKSEQKPGSYTGMISSAAAMVADKAKQATNTVTSKLGYGGSSDQHQESPAVEGLNEKHSEPGGKAENLSIATAVVADKALQAKDVVANKLGYGGTHEEQQKQPVDRDSKGGSVVETVKGKVAPLYGKASEIGSMMASKVQGSGTQHDVGHTTTTTTATTPNDTSGGTDKGVSMKEYLVEKLKPGEDDKALSAVITDALPLHKRKEDGEEAEVNKVTIKGRVTESEEVARRLGRSEDMSYDDAGSGLSSPGKGVIDRIKDAATSWYQKTGVSPAEDIKDGKEGPSSVLSNEDDGGDGQYKVTKGSVNI